MPDKGVVKVKVAIREMEAIITDEVKFVALDSTNASELLIKFEANKDAKAVLDAKYKTMQAEIYALLGYKKYGDKWIGTAEVGTIGGVAVVTVSTQSRPNFETDKFVVANPSLLELVESFTKVNTFTVLKTVR